MAKAQVFNHLKADGALSGYKTLVVEGMHEGVTMFVAQLQRALVSVVINAWYEADFGTEAACGLNLADGRALRKADERLDAVARRAEGYALGVVAGRTGDDAFLLLLVAKLRHHVIRAAHFERACNLQVLRFKVNVTLWIQLGRVYKFGAPKYLTQHITCLVKFV